jgi:hypothetical protein
MPPCRRASKSWQQYWREAWDARGALLHEFPLIFERHAGPPGYRLIRRRTDDVLLPD